MKKHTITVISILCLVILAGAILAACGSSATQVTSGPSSGGLDGQALLQQRCSVCHSTDRVTSQQKTADQWKRTVDRMIANGAQLTPPEEATLVNYLAQNFK